MKSSRLPRHNLAEVRAQFTRMLDRGLSMDSIMAALNLSRATYFSWKSKYRNGGLEGLVVKPIPGGSSKLTDKQTAELRSWLIGRDPRQFQFEFALWTRAIVGDLIAMRFGVSMTPQGVGKLLRRLGFSPQRPLYRAYQQDPDAVARWRQEEFSMIRAEAKRVGAELYFGDEAAVRTDHHAGTTWAPVGQTPVVKVTGERDTVNMISAVTPRGELKFSTFRGKFNASLFIEFLKKLLDGAAGPIFLVVDNAPTHKAKIVHNFVATQDGRLKIFYLPTYSPELNPDEWVWKNVKHDQVGRKPVQRKSDFFELVTKALERLQGLPEIVRSFFNDPALAYINSTEVC